MKASYSRKEFETKYNDPSIYDFFKHIDRKTSHTLDFFDFYGLPKDIIKEENSNRYKIPFEVAPLLAGMIRAFQSAYGNDRRGQAKKAEIKISYDTYHKYISVMQEEVDRLDPYQQALIKNFHSYDDTKIIDLFLPLLLERISIFMVMLFTCNMQTSENFMTTIDLFDKLIADLAKQQVQEDFSLRHSTAFTFNDAISSAFKILAGQTDSIFLNGQINSVELSNFIQSTLKKAKKKSAKNAEEYRMTARKTLNIAYEKYRSTHQDIIELHNENIKRAVEQANKQSTYRHQLVKSNTTAWILSQLDDIPKEVERFVQIVNGLGKYSALRGKCSDGELDQEAYNSLSKTDQTIYDCYKYELAKYKTNALENSDDYTNFLKQRIAERTEFMKKSAFDQTEILQNYCRTYMNELFQNTDTEALRHAVFEALNPIATLLLTYKLKKQTNALHKTKSEK